MGLDSMAPVLASLADALWPSMPVPANVEDCNDDLVRYYTLPGSAYVGATKQAQAILEERLFGPAQQQLRLLLLLLSYRCTTVLLMGRHALSYSFPFLKSFPEMTVQQRQQGLMAWQRSPFTLFKKAYHALKSLVSAALIGHTDAHGRTPLLAPTGYASGPEAVQRYAAAPAPAPGALAAEEVLASGLVHLPRAWEVCGGVEALKAYLVKRGFQLQGTDSAAAAAATTDKQQLQGGKGVGGVGPSGAAAPGSKVLQFPVLDLDADVVVVGSGAGGGVAAGVLAAAGFKVVVLEKSSWARMADMTWVEGQAVGDMFERGGFATSQDGSLTILAGSTLGGGTKINWCASIRPPPHLRSEWAEQHNLPAFTSSAFDEALEAVCARAGVNTGSRYNGQNALLKAGLEGLGKHAGEYPRNCLSKECSVYCTLGCKTGHKQSTDLTWLVDCVKAGGRVMTGVMGERIMLESQEGGDRQYRTVGLEASASLPDGRSIKLRVHAPRVVAAAGTLHTPALLLRSGISCSGNVGAHLRVHPASGITSEFGKDACQAALGRSCVDGYKGVMMQTYSVSVAHWDANGYGAFTSVPATHPALLSVICPWHRPTQLKEMLMQLPGQMAAAVVFVRDSGSGRVTVDGAGRAVFDYWPCETTRKHMLEGLELAVRAHVAAGAESVLVPHAARPDLTLRVDRSLPEQQQQQQLEAFIQRLWAAGVEKFELPVFSAHQMGTARMGSDRRTSVCDPSGQCWDVSGLYIADSSTFPTASGVNPMITAEAIAYMVAKGMAASATGKAQTTAAPAGGSIRQWLDRGTAVTNWCVSKYVEEGVT